MTIDVWMVSRHIKVEVSDFGLVYHLNRSKIRSQLRTVTVVRVFVVEVTLEKRSKV